VPSLDRDEVIRVAAGERIVAFARPGKPPEILFMANRTCRPHPGIPAIFRAVLNGF
jgi:hypothetical protein